MDLVTILQSLPSKANLSKLEKFLELAISTKVGRFDFRRDFEIN